MVKEIQFLKKRAQEFWEAGKRFFCPVKNSWLIKTSPGPGFGKSLK